MLLNYCKELGSSIKGERAWQGLVRVVPCLLTERLTFGVVLTLAGNENKNVNSPEVTLQCPV